MARTRWHRCPHPRKANADHRQDFHGCARRSARCRNGTGPKFASRSDKHEDLWAANDLHRHLEQVVDGLKEGCKLRPSLAIGEARVMITKNEHHVPATNSGSVRRGIATAETEVARVVEPVVGTDTGVNAIDDRGIHRHDASERPAAVLDDVGVAQVGARRAENGHVGFLDHSCSQSWTRCRTLHHHRDPDRPTTRRRPVPSYHDGTHHVDQHRRWFVRSDVYDIRMAELDERVRGEVISTEGRTHREIEDGIFGLVQRALSRLTKPPRRGSQSP